MTTQNTSPFRYDSETLYSLCTSSELAQVHAGFQQLGNYLFIILRKRLNVTRFDDMFVEDSVQIALREIWRNMQEGNGANNPDTFLNWATTIAVRRNIDQIRYETRRQGDELSDELAETFGAPEDLIDHQIVLDEKKIELLTSLRQHPKLSSESKTVVIDGFLFDKTDAELAHALLTPQPNVRVIRHRNLGKLKRDAQFLAMLRS